MLVLNVVQRGVGFVRGLLFCRLLSEEALGQWSLAYSFLLLAAPLIVLGLPGSFGRYVEYYRQRGQLRSFLMRMSIVTALLAGTGVLVMALLGRPLTALAFGDPSLGRLMTLSLVALCTTTVFNYLAELLTALRQVRAVSWMHFVNSLSLTIVGLGLLTIWEASAEAVVVAFGISSLIGIAAMAPWWCELRAEFRSDCEQLDLHDVWRKLLPFAGWMWFTNLLANLADLVDRFMLMHASGLDVHTATALVGQYHSSRVVPVLLSSLALTIGAIALPHLSHAWEAGRKADVSAQMNLGLKLLSVLFTAGSMAVMWTSPILFDWVLAGKYDAGLVVLPWALLSCVWLSLVFFAQNYLWCAERSHQAAATIAVGLVLNGLFDFIALPWGLAGVMAARCWATLAMLLVVLWFNHRLEMQLSRGLALATVLPLTVLLGPALGTVLVIGILVLDWRTGWLFDAQEEPQLRAIFDKALRKLKWWPAT